jgi:hypothetical protein
MYYGTFLKEQRRNDQRLNWEKTKGTATVGKLQRFPVSYAPFYFA